MGTRDQIIDAAARVMTELGLARTTTKEIARAAGFSEATLYKHFTSKEELFLDVLQERLPRFRATAERRAEQAGEGTIRGNLVELARLALAFYGRSVPMAASIFAEPQLLARHREATRRVGVGPHRANEFLSAYLRAEQECGRLPTGANPDTVAALLLGACFQRAFLRNFAGEENDEQVDEQFVTDVVDTLLRGLSPEGREGG